jgi:protein-tyrosine kinase
MGRIYDAMAKLEKKEQEGPLPFEEAQNGKPNGHRDSSDAAFKSHVDFISYSLNSAVAEGRNGSVPLRKVPSEVPRSTPALPVREAQLDMERLDPHLTTLNECDPAAAEQYQRLASSLISAAAERPLKRIMITSALQGDGRTCVMLNLAGALSQAQRRVLVVDTDLRHPSVSRLLGLDVEVGLTEALAGKTPVSQAICKVLPGGFDVLPRRAHAGNVAELLATPDFEKLLESFDSEYDFILFDSAPLLTADDAHFLLRYMDTTLVVVAQGKCSSTMAARAVARIAREDIFGVVLNRLTN